MDHPAAKDMHTDTSNKEVIAVILGVFAIAPVLQDHEVIVITYQLQDLSLTRVVQNVVSFLFLRFIGHSYTQDNTYIHVNLQKYRQRTHSKF